MLADLVWVSTLFINLVHGNHNWNPSRLSVVQCFNRLRHNSVVGCDNQDCDVGNLGTTGTHCGERFVTRGVDEGNRTVNAFVSGVNLVSTDVLGDPTVLAGDDV